MKAFHLIANLVIALALLVALAGGALVLWGQGGREIGHGVAVILGGVAAGVGLVALLLTALIKLVAVATAKAGREGEEGTESDPEPE